MFRSMFSSLILAGALTPALAQETAIITFNETLTKEIQAKAFTLAAPGKVHVYARGDAAGSSFFAYGWILDAATRQVVWQMDGRTSKAEGDYQVADQQVDLPAGTYEVYFANHGYGWEHFPFSRGTRNIDRSKVKSTESEAEYRRHWFRNTFQELFSFGNREWREKAGNYGLTLSVASAEVKTFEAPVAWRNQALTLTADLEGGERRSGFHLDRPMNLHVYAQGERGSRGAMRDDAWIMDVRTRKRVWEMDDVKAQYAGGAERNRRQVETIQLPPGDYVACVSTDDSHSPLDWQSAPPCDPLRYGLTLSLTRGEDAAAFHAVPEKQPWKPLAAVLQPGSHTRKSTAFTLSQSAKVRVYALGESDGKRLEDYGWIEDGSGKQVWLMTFADTRWAGGARKNRVADLVIDLPAGSYTLHYRTDGSHDPEDWNDDAPRDAANYGVSLFRME